MSLVVHQHNGVWMHGAALFFQNCHSVFKEKHGAGFAVL